MAKLAGVDKLSLKGRLRPVKGVYNSHGGHGTIEIVKKLIEDKIGYNKIYYIITKGGFKRLYRVSQRRLSKLPFCVWMAIFMHQQRYVWISCMRK